VRGRDVALSLILHRQPPSLSCPSSPSWPASGGESSNSEVEEARGEMDDAAVVVEGWRML
jgi:hypothetical protein